MGASSQQCPITQCFEHPGIPCQNNTAVMDQPPYSPDLATCDFFVSKTRRNHYSHLQKFNANKRKNRYILVSLNLINKILLFIKIMDIHS